jgi:hypothetical protein
MPCLFPAAHAANRPLTPAYPLPQLWRSWSIKALEEKAWLIVDKGAFVLGGVDEADTLLGYLAATEGLENVEKFPLHPDDDTNEGQPIHRHRVSLHGR